MEQGAKYLRTVAWEDVAPGFVELDDVIEGMRELAEDDESIPLTAQEAEAVVRELWETRREQLAAAPPTDGPTDDERLVAALADLEDAGLVTGMRLGFDTEEAAYEARELIADGGGRARGYVAFHSQDAARLARAGATLHLCYGAVSAQPWPDRRTHDDAARSIASDVVAALTRQGLTASWDGLLTSRVAVVDLDWRRPLPSSGGAAK